MKVLLFVMAAGAAVAANGKDVAEHCEGACLNLLEPSDPDTLVELDRRQILACKDAIRKSARDGKLCRSTLTNTAKAACKASCIKQRTGAIIKNEPELVTLRRGCQHYQGGRFGMFMEKSCNIGFDAGAAFDREGLALRSQIDAICASEAESDEPAKVAEEPAVVATSNKKEEEPAVVEPPQAEVVEEEEVLAEEEPVDFASGDDLLDKVEKEVAELIREVQAEEETELQTRKLRTAV